MANQNLIGKLSVLIIIINLLPVYAQVTGAIKGIVTDTVSGEPLSNCNIYLPKINNGTSTNEHGYYYIPAIPADVELDAVISYVGYLSKRIKVKVQPDRINIENIQLIPAPINIPETEIIAEKIKIDNEPKISVETITGKSIEMVPKGVEADVFRALQGLPGVTSTGDVSARYFVRGGAGDQNLVLINDVPIYSPFHALGLFSVIDPEVVSAAEFYKGGFPSEYTGRLSSLLDIKTKEGNKNSFAGIVSGSFLTVKALAEGPIPDGSFFLTGRKSHSNTILKKFLRDDNVPVDFYDMSFKVTYANTELLDDAKFMVHGFMSGDQLDSPDPTREDFKWSNQILGLRYFQWISGSPLFYQVALSMSNFSGELMPNLSQRRARVNKVEDITLKADFNYIFNNKDEVAAGVKFMGLNSKLKLENVNGAFTDIEDGGVNVSIFGKYKMLQIERFGLDVGARFHLSRLARGTAGEISMEPRANISYTITDGVKIKAGWGIFIQEMTTISDENEIISVFEPWIITPKYLKPAEAVNYIFGTEFRLNSALTFTAETYYKSINNLAVVNERKYFFSDPDLTAASSQSYGFEFGGNLETSDIKLTGAYSYGRVFKVANGMKYEPRYDSRHNVNLLLEYYLGDGFYASAQWAYNSGYPFTQQAGYYNKLGFSDIWARDIYFTPYIILAERNAKRLPDYHRLDLSIKKQFSIGFVDFYFDVSVVNVYDRKNFFYFDRDTGTRVNMLPILPTATLRAEI